MQSGRFFRLPLSCFCILMTMLGHAVLSQAVEVTGSNITEGQWLDDDAKVQVHLSEPPQTNELRVFVGHTDVTALFEVDGNDLIFQPGIMNLPHGENEISVYRVHSDVWDSIGTVAIRVRKVAGFDRFEVTPQLNLTVKAQLKEGHSVDAGAPPRSTFNDLTGQGGINIDVARDDLSMQARANLIGSSYREEALRFAQKGVHASKVDLSDYLISLNKGSGGLYVGHYQYQGSRYVMSNANNRGITASYRLNERASIMATAQNTTPIVGFDNFVGLNQSDNITYGVSGGIELFERPGALKVEGYYSDASRRSDLGFNVGAITDAEKNQAMAVRVLASTPESMFSLETELAESTFTNPNDPALDQGFGVVAVNKTTDRAYFGRLMYNAYQGNMESGKPLSLSLSYEFEHIDPLFKTIGSFPQADLERGMFSLTGTLGDLTLTASTEERRDNLENLTTVLTTKTRNSQISASLALKDLFASDQPESILAELLPSISVNYNHVHQFGANRPDLNPLSGFSLSHIPNQLTKTIGVSSNWSGDIWSVGYNYNQSRQDNRQLGREKADFVNVLHGLNAQIMLFNQLTLTSGISRSSVRDIEQAISTYTLSRNIGLNWTLFENWTLSSSLEASRISDTKQNSNSNSLFANSQVTWQYSMPSYGGKSIPVQAYLRYERQINKTVDNLFGFSSDVSGWKVLAGISLNVF